MERYREMDQKPKLLKFYQSNFLTLQEITRNKKGWVSFLLEIFLGTWVFM